MNKNVIVSLALVTSALAAALPARANAAQLAQQCPASVPAAIAAPADQRLRFVLPADGVQIYMCTANAAGATSWTFIAPNANLFKSEDLFGTHFIGPVWQANDGSAVKAARIAGATVDATAIPWLLLGSVGNVGPGKLANISSIQRLNTVGGVAPAASECTPATLGTVAQVHYTTDYFLYETHATNGTNPGCR
jgi:hypothetical protein